MAYCSGSDSCIKSSSSDMLPRVALSLGYAPTLDTLQTCWRLVSRSEKWSVEMDIFPLEDRR
jgi:hypothetical protein